MRDNLTDWLRSANPDSECNDIRCEEAADEIESLRAENARLREALNRRAINPAEAARVLLGMDYNERMRAVLAIARVAQHPDADRGIGATLATSMLFAALRAIAEGDA